MKTGEHLTKFIPLYLYDELDDDEKTNFERHVTDCEACRQQVREFRANQKVLDEKILLAPTEALLTQSRQRLRERLRREQRRSIREPRWQPLLDYVLARRAAAGFLGAVALFLFGVLLGRTIWAPQALPPALNPQVAADVYSDGIRQPLINNIDLIQYDPLSGQVTVRYKSVSDVLLKGNVKDAAIRNILAYAIRREAHPGRRLTAVKAFGGHRFADSEVEDALIYALVHDTVEGVRLKAAKVLKSLPINERIKKAFIQVLLNDPNPAVRIEAVDALSDVREPEDVVSVFQHASKDDENEFIRLRTSEVVERESGLRIEKFEGTQPDEDEK